MNTPPTILQTFAGPLAKISNEAPRHFEKGFLVQVRTSASMVGHRKHMPTLSRPVARMTPAAE